MHSFSFGQISVRNRATQNIDLNLALVDRLRAIADSRGASVAQLAIAWVLSRGADMVPLVGPGGATGFARHSRHSTSNTPAPIWSVSSGRCPPGPLPVARIPNSEDPAFKRIEDPKFCF